MSADVWLEKDGEKLGEGIDCPWCEALEPGGEGQVVNIANTAIGNHAWNLTYNLSPMLWAAGMPPWSVHVGQRAGDLAPVIASVVDRLTQCPEVYRPMQAENGWGTYEDALRVMAAYGIGLLTHPNAKVGGWL